MSGVRNGHRVQEGSLKKPWIIIRAIARMRRPTRSDRNAIWKCKISWNSILHGYLDLLFCDFRAAACKGPQQGAPTDRRGCPRRVDDATEDRTPLMQEKGQDGRTAAWKVDGRRRQNGERQICGGAFKRQTPSTFTACCTPIYTYTGRFSLSFPLQSHSDHDHAVFRWPCSRGTCTDDTPGWAEMGGAPAAIGTAIMALARATWRYDVCVCHAFISSQRGVEGSHAYCMSNCGRPLIGIHAWQGWTDQGLGLPHFRTAALPKALLLDLIFKWLLYILDTSFWPVTMTFSQSSQVLAARTSLKRPMRLGNATGRSAGGAYK
jgi:hypothetical protein